MRRTVHYTPSSPRPCLWALLFWWFWRALSIWPFGMREFGFCIASSLRACLLVLPLWPLVLPQTLPHSHPKLSCIHTLLPYHTHAPADKKKGRKKIRHRCFQTRACSSVSQLLLLVCSHAHHGFLYPFSVTSSPLACPLLYTTVLHTHLCQARLASFG